MNEIALLADALGAVRRSIGDHLRICSDGFCMRDGCDGSWLLKDIGALSRAAEEAGIWLGVLGAVEAVNEHLERVP